MVYLYKVYMYTNDLNGKVYIGRTKNTLEKRAQRDGANYRESTRFYEAISKYGWENFTPAVLADNLTLEQANELEAYYIGLYKSTDAALGYNIQLGGNDHTISDAGKVRISQKAILRYKDPASNPMFGRKHRQDSIERMSEKKRGKKNPMYGKTWNETQRERCGCKGRHLTLLDERRAELREHGRKLGLERAKTVLCIEDDLVFPSLTLAANYYDVNVATLCAQINGRQKTCRGRHFKYID